MTLAEALEDTTLAVRELGAAFRSRDIERRERELHATARMPHRLDSVDHLLALPQVLARFTGRVPADMFKFDANEALVNCTCGEPVVVGIRELQSCTCARWFVFDGTNVHVARFEEAE